MCIGYMQTLWHFIRDLTICESCMGWRAHRNQTPRILRDDGTGKLGSLGERANGKGGMDMSVFFSNILFTMNTQIFFDFQWPLTTVSDNHSFPGLPPQPQYPDNTVKWILLSYKSSWNQPLYSEILRLKKCNFYYSQNSTEVPLVA